MHVGLSDLKSPSVQEIFLLNAKLMVLQKPLLNRAGKTQLLLRSTNMIDQQLKKKKKKERFFSFLCCYKEMIPKDILFLSEKHQQSGVLRKSLESGKQDEKRLQNKSQPSKYMWISATGQITEN